jgi:hypothetical protein
MVALRVFLIICLVVTSLATPSTLLAGKPDKGFFSLRGGFSEERGASSNKNFQQYEGALTLTLPWQWRPGPKLLIRTGLDITAGVLSGHDEEAFVGSIGPRLSFRTFDETFSLDIGIAPSLISRHEFENEDFGGLLQFTSFAGFYVHFRERYRLGYRLQHMSNAGIYTENPGVNLHMFEGGFLF